MLHNKTIFDFSGQKGFWFCAGMLVFQALVWVVARQDRSQQRWIDQPESCSVKSSKVIAIWEGEIVPRVVRGDCFGAFLSMKRVDGFEQRSAAARVEVECI